jgi:hypothetical protein
MLSAFGVDDGRISKARQLTDDQKRRATTVGVAGAGVYGYHAGTALHARGTAQRMSDPQRAKNVAETLRQHKGQAMNATMQGVKAQSSAYTSATKANPDVKRVRHSADRWSSNFRQVNRIRGAYDAERPIPGVGRTLLRPVKSKAESDSNVMRNLNNAKTESPTLFRGMKTPRRSYKVGDDVDFHDLTSWSADNKVADTYAKTSAGKKKGSGDHSHVFEREPGHGTSFEAASPQFQQREWVAGGKHKVTGISPNGAIRVARIVKSAFGVDDARLSKANPDSADVHVPGALSRKERRKRVATSAGIAGVMSAAGGKALKLKPVELAVTTGIGSAGSALQTLNGTRPPR